MNDTTISQDKPPADQTGNRDLLDRLIFEQDLNEVHLLIDFYLRPGGSLDHDAVDAEPDKTG